MKIWKKWKGNAKLGSAKYYLIVIYYPLLLISQYDEKFKPEANKIAEALNILNRCQHAVNSEPITWLR